MTGVVVPDGVWVYVDAGVVSAADIEGVRVLVTLASRTTDMTLDPLVWVMMGLVLRTVRDGHSCIDLDHVDRWGPEQADLEWPIGPDPWLALLGRHPALIGPPEALDGDPRPPVVLHEHRLYMSRVFHDETLVARRLTSGDGERVRIVLGGPGSGKTTWVAETLSTWSDGSIPAIALCAPTGKASRRLKDVLEAVLRKNKAPAAVFDALKDAPSVTVHKLLGYSPNRSPRWAFNAETTLPYKLVIVDEASMMSLDLMARLLEALDPKAEIWLVGDPDQLASVGAGTVLADIDSGSADEDKVLHSRTKRLTDQHRFPKDSSIARLATAVRVGDVAAVTSVLSSPTDELRWIDPVVDPDGVRAVIDEVVEHAGRMMAAGREGDASTALSLKAQLQVLSATHAGVLGVNDWNRLVEEHLGPDAAPLMYPGKPLMVTRNDSSKGLSNGDVGVVVAGDRGSGKRAWKRGSHEMVVAFGDVGDPVRVPIVRLPQVETVHALTIHKSQGSEYDHVVVVLPQVESRVVTRELLYTGVSRPRTRLTIIATAGAIERAVKTQVQRATGLEHRL